MKYIFTAERVKKTEVSENYVYQRSLLAYLESAKIIHGNVLELGSGSGYGQEVIGKKCTEFLTVDKYVSTAVQEISYKMKHVTFLKLKFPPLKGIPSNYFDYVISFQVIEHIENDNLFVQEVHRVLKPGGKFIVTTPNKEMSLTRNPYHVREYTDVQLNDLLSKEFYKIQMFGVFGNEKVFQYYLKNKESVQKILKYDVFNLSQKLPASVLKIPYDLGNYLNRKYLYVNNKNLVETFDHTDYYLDKVKGDCFDLYYIAEKKK